MIPSTNCDMVLVSKVRYYRFSKHILVIALMFFNKVAGRAARIPHLDDCPLLGLMRDSKLSKITQRNRLRTLKPAHEYLILERLPTFCKGLPL